MTAAGHQLMRRGLQEGNDALAPPLPGLDGPMVFTLSMVEEAAYNDTSKEGNNAQRGRYHCHRHRRVKLSLGTCPPSPRSIHRGQPEEMQTTAEVERDRTEDHTWPAITSKVSHLAAQIA